MRWFLARRQQVVDDVEALLALGIVDAADVDQHLELAAARRRAGSQHFDDVRRRNRERRLAERHSARGFCGHRGHRRAVSWLSTHAGGLRTRSSSRTDFSCVARREAPHWPPPNSSPSRRQTPRNRASSGFSISSARERQTSADDADREAREPAWTSALRSRRQHASALDRAGAADFPLQQQHAVDQRLGRRRAARHVDVDRHDAVAAAHHGIGIVVVAAAVGALPIEMT